MLLLGVEGKYFCFVLKMKCFDGDSYDNKSTETYEIKLRDRRWCFALTKSANKYFG